MASSRSGQGGGTGAGTDRGGGGDHPTTTASVSAQGTAADPFVLPTGCLCSVEYPAPGTDDDWTWFYKTACPVSLEDHPMFRRWFRLTVNAGQGHGGAPEGGDIVIDDGKVSCLFFLLRCVLLT